MGQVLFFWIFERRTSQTNWAFTKKEKKEEWGSIGKEELLLILLFHEIDS